MQDLDSIEDQLTDITYNGKKFNVTWVLFMQKVEFNSN